MASPIRFRLPVPKIKFVNRCIICGRVISDFKTICDSCAKRRRF